MKKEFNLQKKIYTIIAFVILGLFGLTGASTVSAYCTEGFFQYADGQLKLLDPVNDVYINIGDQNQTGAINAIGFDTTNCRIYGINGNFQGTVANSFANLFRTDPSNGVRNILGPITNASNPSQTLTHALVNALTDTDGTPPNFTTSNYGKGISIGEVHNGKLYIAIGNQGNQRAQDKDNDLYIIDIATQTYTKVDVTYAGSNKSANRIGPDIVYHNGSLYSINAFDNSQKPRLNVVDPATGVLTSKEISGLGNTSDNFGAVWLAKDEGVYRMFTSRNTNGNIYEIIGFDTATPTAILLGSFGSLNNNDGASDPEAPVPNFGINAKNDTETGSLNTPIIINWINNDTGNTIFSISGFDVISTNSGTIINNGNGTFTYTPAIGFYGTDTFNYTICLDGTIPAICDTATVTVIIPVSIDAIDDSATTTLNTPVNINWINNDTGSSAYTLSGFDTTSVNGGTITRSGDEFVYTPTTGFAGTDTFNYTICLDGTIPVVCDTATVTVTIPNNLPIANDDSVTTPLNTPVNIPYFGNDTYGLDGTGSISLTGTSPSNGIVTLIDGVITYTPNTGFAGTDTFQYQICDSNGDCDTAIVTVTIPNNLPIANDDVATTPINTPVTISVLNNDNYGLDGTGSISLTSNTPNNGTVIQSGNQFIYTPNTGFAGTDTFEYQICDSNGDCDTAIVTVTIIAPISDISVVKTGPGSFMSGNIITYIVRISNNGPDAATGTLTDIFPTGFTYISSSTGTVSGNTLTYSRYLTSGDSYTILITGSVSGTDGNRIANTATIISSENDSNTGNNSSTTTGVIYIPSVGGGGGGTYPNNPPIYTIPSTPVTTIPIAEVLANTATENKPQNYSLLELLSTGPTGKTNTKALSLPKTGADV